MIHRFAQHPIAIAALAALGTLTLVAAPTPASAGGKTPGQYVAGDFHNHTTCSDGTISMQKLVKKATDKSDGNFGLDWFVQAGHGGYGSRNCSLVEDASLSTADYPFVAGTGPTTTWTNSIGATKLKGDGGGAGGSGNMWRWQSLQEVQYQTAEYLNQSQNLPVFLGLESVVAGHEHASMTVITGQMPDSAASATALNVAGYVPLGGHVGQGNASALAKWSYCFDRGDTDTSRGNITGSTTGNNWNCAVTGSQNASDTSWNATGQKLIQSGSATGIGDRGHSKTVEALKWMAENHPTGSYYVPAHLERAGPFNANGNNGYNIEHLRDFNNAAPKVAFGFETQPGHGAAADRGEYKPLRQTINGVSTDSVGGTTYGGTGVYGAVVGGVWDALLGEGRNFWFFASSDWHNRGSFGPDDRRTMQDFLPGEYQRNYTMVRNNGAKLNPQAIVDGLRTGNNFAASGQLIDRLAFIACASYPGIAKRSNAAVEALAVAAATHNTDIDTAGCATMGEKLVVRPGAEIVVAVVVRDPAGSNYSPYTFANPSLLQIGMNQPINQPVLDHIDVVRGMVTGYKTPGSADYAGQWPANTDWLKTDGSTALVSDAVVPAAAKNLSAAVVKTFASNGAAPWAAVHSGVDNTTFLKMSYRIPAVAASQYVRLRGSNLPAAVPFETDTAGNPLSDLATNASNPTKLMIPCTTVGTVLTGSAIDGCPAHLPVVAGQKMVAYDVAAWADLWFYSNPIYVEVSGSTVVAGVK